MRCTATAMLAVLILSAVGCSSGNAGPSGDAKPAGFDTPEATLQELLKRIAAEDSPGACRLFLPGGATAFARQHEAGDCPAAMDIVIGKLTDRENFAAHTLKPSGEYPGVVINGDSATFGGSCTGWTGPSVKSGIRPSDLGFFGLKRTGDGWMINDNKMPNGSCGG
jgi:hypothetical protein